MFGIPPAPVKTSRIHPPHKKTSIRRTNPMDGCAAPLTGLDGCEEIMPMGALAAYRAGVRPVLIND
jgi:hypothetical protein